MRKLALISLAVIFVLSMVSLASAAPNTTNTTNKASLLVWPKVAAWEDWEGSWQDTIIFLSNDSTKEVDVKCYWMDWNQNIQDFMFKLTPNQPVAFSALDGTNVRFVPFIYYPYDPPVTIPPFAGPFGSLYCWVVDPTDSYAFNYNHLYGNAMILSGWEDGFIPDQYFTEAAVLYNAFSFVAGGQPNATSSVPCSAAEEVDGNPCVKLPLTGATTSPGYSACPNYLVGNFIPDAGLFFGEKDVDAELTLIPCKQDLRQDRTPTYTKAKFDVWNANETKYTGAYQCFKCFAEFVLDWVGWYDGYYEGGLGPGFGGDKFSLSGLKTFAARYRVQGVKSDKICCPSGDCTTQAVGLLGVELYIGGNDYFYAGTTLHGGGIDATGGVIWYDKGSQAEEAARK